MLQDIGTALYWKWAVLRDTKKPSEALPCHFFNSFASNASVLAAGGFGKARH